MKRFVFTFFAVAAATGILGILIFSPGLWLAPEWRETPVGEPVLSGGERSWSLPASSFEYIGVKLFLRGLIGPDPILRLANENLLVRSVERGNREWHPHTDRWLLVIFAQPIQPKGMRIILPINVPGSVIAAVGYRRLSGAGALSLFVERVISSPHLQISGLPLLVLLVLFACVVPVSILLVILSTSRSE